MSAELEAMVDRLHARVEELYDAVVETLERAEEHRAEFGTPNECDAWTAVESVTEPLRAITETETTP